MEEGAIVKVSLPESDGKIRSRPALILKRIPPYNDWLMCVISGGVHNRVDGLDILIDVKHPDFLSMRLKYPALIRAGFLFTLSEEKIEGTIGSVGKATLKELKKNITDFISQ